MLQIFGRCESCIKNMQRSICDMTCSKNQSTFMAAAEILIDDKTNNSYIEEIEVNNSNNY